MRLYLSKKEANLIKTALSHLEESPEVSNLINRIETCIKVQKPFDDPPDEAGR